MKLQVEIKRQKSAAENPYVQTIEYECESGETTVAMLLKQFNALPGLTDTDGRPVGEIKWECSCLQKKCGACAMLINGKPRLACDTKLSDLKRRRVRLEPLKKFPVVCDLVVDRSIMLENLKSITNWLEAEAKLSPRAEELAYDASRCLQCGCCLEVCPNFIAGGSFYSAAAFVPASRILSELSKGKKYEIVRTYQKHIYSGCGKSLSCHNICPAGIDIQRLLVNSNAVVVWKRFFN